MRREQARRQFELYLAKQGAFRLPQDAHEALRLMLGYYRDVRADDVVIDDDGDMLLFQWGTYDWGQGLQFELDLTRQLIGPGEDPKIWQLHLTYRLAPSEELTALGNGDKWCMKPAALAEFELFVLGHPALAAVHGKPATVELDYECV